jgi:ribosomal protein S18 acetylase RimI-like enzyme
MVDPNLSYCCFSTDSAADDWPSGGDSRICRQLQTIHAFMVLKAYRNRGIGKALLCEVERIAKDRKCCKITLEVQMKNTAARGIYHSFGFKASFLDPEAGEQLSLTKTLLNEDD